MGRLIPEHFLSLILVAQSECQTRLPPPRNTRGTWRVVQGLSPGNLPRSPIFCGFMRKLPESTLTSEDHSSLGLALPRSPAKSSFKSQFGFFRPFSVRTSNNFFTCKPCALKAPLKYVSHYINKLDCLQVESFVCVTIYDSMVLNWLFIGHSHMLSLIWGWANR